MVAEDSHEGQTTSIFKRCVTMAGNNRSDTGWDMWPIRHGLLILLK